MVIKISPAVPTISAPPTSAAPAAVEPMAPLALTPLPPPGGGKRMALQPETPHLLRQAYFADQQRALLDSLGQRQVPDSALTPPQRSACECVLRHIAARSTQ